MKIHNDYLHIYNDIIITFQYLLINLKDELLLLYYYSG